MKSYRECSGHPAVRHVCEVGVHVLIISKITINYSVPQEANRLLRTRESRSIGLLCAQRIILRNLMDIKAIVNEFRHCHLITLWHLPLVLVVHCYRCLCAR